MVLIMVVVQQSLNTNTVAIEWTSKKLIDMIVASLTTPQVISVLPTYKRGCC